MSWWDESSAACVGALMKMDDVESFDSLQSVGLGWAELPGWQFYSLLTCLTATLFEFLFFETSFLASSKADFCPATAASLG